MANVVEKADRSFLFNVNEQKVLRFALVQFEKSVLRAAAKPGQPESVAVEFRRAADDVGNLIRKLQ